MVQTPDPLSRRDIRVRLACVSSVIILAILQALPAAAGPRARDLDIMFEGEPGL